MTVMQRGERGGSSGGRLDSVWARLSARFWLLPALITAGSIVLFFATHYLDQATQTNLARLPVVFSGGATSARSVLSAISGSLITVIATVFSLTVVTLQLASSSYSPRILRNFTSDSGVQVVLGTYIATFLYSLLVLRIVRTPEAEGAEFNPVISVTVAVLLTLLCVALLIYYVGHIVHIIQSSTIVGGAQEDTMAAIAGLDNLEDAPAKCAEDPWARAELAGLLARDPLVARARKSGYVRYVNVDAVLDAVVRGDTDAEKTTVVELPFGPGAFVAAGLPVVRIWRARGLGSGVEDELVGAVTLARERSFSEDFAFGLRQLSDIALKGLSPGINDPTTAMQAMDRMEAIFVALGKKALPARLREREIDGAKVVAKVGYYGFDDAVGLAFDQIRRAAFASGQVAVLERLLEILERAIRANGLPERQRTLWARVFTVARLAPDRVPDPEDAANLVLRAVEIGGLLLRAGQGKAVRSDLEELAGLSEDLRGGGRVREAVEAALGGHGRR